MPKSAHTPPHYFTAVAQAFVSSPGLQCSYDCCRACFEHYPKRSVPVLWTAYCLSSTALAVAMRRGRPGHLCCAAGCATGPASVGCSGLQDWVAAAQSSSKPRANALRKRTLYLTDVVIIQDQLVQTCEAKQSMRVCMNDGKCTRVVLLLLLAATGGLT